MLLLVPPCSSVSATIGNPWLSSPLSSAPLNKSTVRTTASSWQCMRPSSTSDIWSKADTLSFLRITSLSLMFSNNGPINACHDNSIIWSLLANSQPTSGISQGKTTLWQTPYWERTPSRRLLITMLLRVPRIRTRSSKTFWKWFHALTGMSAHSRDRCQYLLRHAHSTTAAIYNHAFQMPGLWHPPRP